MGKVGEIGKVGKMGKSWIASCSYLAVAMTAKNIPLWSERLSFIPLWRGQGEDGLEFNPLRGCGVCGVYYPALRLRLTRGYACLSPIGLMELQNINN
jgi:hypothetical protein